jgi:hydroxymethylglutaryl-CoA lyase
MDSSVRIVEVSPRDGLQNISRQVPTETKIQLIQRLHDAGLAAIELTSIVSPRAVPQLKDGQDVLKSPPVQALLSDKSNRLPVLVPNTRGAEAARRHGVSEVAVFVSATGGFSKANINCTVDEGIARAKAIAQEAKAHGVAIRG